MILDPLSIATDGYIGEGPAPGTFCPTPLAIGSGGYIRLLVAVVEKARAATHDKFNDLRDYTAQALKEDEELLVICQGLLKIICR